ncbi:ABC transporter ATP-binding protein [Allorhizocola rhizosphaerae]|uniref:ABC transporter ATP-binding protein n=1 Tax=Allorhizocola rhizosphaerae TaxID=1872709 RepID=UPI000E3D0DB9|nr:ABC transporter ATP-binding protein [Allorhizocola rhizosphaerae]
MTLDLMDVAVGHRGRAILAHVSLKLASGETAAIRGANGVGKSTLLRCIAGVAEPLHGEIRVNDVPADDRDPRFRRMVSSLLDSGSWYQALTAAEHVDLIVRANRPVSEGWFEPAQLLAELGIGHVGGALPGRLSTGELQRLAVAMTLARPSALLLLDEPERHLDRSGRESVAGLLRRYAERGGAVVIVTHDDDLAAAIGAQQVSASDFAA